MADVTISSLSPIAELTSGLLLPVSNGSSTGSVTIANINSLISSGNVTTALGFTPYNATNPSGYITNTNASAAKAWVNFNGQATNGACVLNKNYNISAVSRTASGTYSITINNGALNDANYLTIATCRNNLDSAGVGVETNATKSATNVTVSFNRIDGAGAVNPTKCFVVLFGT